MPRRDPEARRKYLADFQRKWVAERREIYFRDKTCSWCCSREQLMLAHAEPADRRSLRGIWSWSAVRRDAALAKCVVLCHECYWVKFANDFYPRPTHGTASMYRRFKCRCVKCRRWNRDKVRRCRLKRSAC